MYAQLLSATIPDHRKLPDLRKKISKEHVVHNDWVSYYHTLEKFGLEGEIRCSFLFSCDSQEAGFALMNTINKAEYIGRHNTEESENAYVFVWHTSIRDAIPLMQSLREKEDPLHKILMDIFTVMGIKRLFVCKK